MFRLFQWLSVKLSSCLIFIWKLPWSYFNCVCQKIDICPKPFIVALNLNSNYFVSLFDSKSNHWEKLCILIHHISRVIKLRHVRESPLVTHLEIENAILFRKVLMQFARRFALDSRTYLINRFKSIILIHN